jgi:hypothetical protein
VPSIILAMAKLKRTRTEACLSMSENMEAKSGEFNFLDVDKDAGELASKEDTGTDCMYTNYPLFSELL